MGGGRSDGSPTGEKVINIGKIRENTAAHSGDRPKRGQLGHRDSGTLVTQLYSYPGARRSRPKIHEPYRRPGAIKPLRAVAEYGA